MTPPWPLFVGIVVGVVGCRPPTRVEVVAATKPAPPSPRTNIYRAVELNGVYTVMRTDSYKWVAQYDYPTCEKAQEVANRMWYYTTNDAAEAADPVKVRHEAERLALPWVECHEGAMVPVPATPTTNVSTHEARQQLAAQQGWPSNAFDSVPEPVQLPDGKWAYANTEATNTPAFTFKEFAPTDDFITISTNGVKSIVVHYDGSVLLANTNLDDASRRFWHGVGEMMPRIFADYCEMMHGHGGTNEGGAK